MQNDDLKSSGGTEAEAKLGRQPFQVSQEPVIFGEQPSTTEPQVESPTESPFDHLGELPASYGTKFVFLVARDPYWLFAYWDFGWNEIPEASSGTTRLKVYLADGTLESEVELHRHTSNWYVPVKKADTAYYIDLGVETAAGEWIVTARSGLATTPSDKLSDFGESQFATLPFHLGFQKLVDELHKTMGEGESLVAALSRLQGQVNFGTLAGSSGPDWTPEQRTILESLLGKEAVEVLLDGSGQIDEMLKKFIEEGLNSESGSELSLRTRFAEILGVSESSLSSGVGASWFTGDTSSQSGAGLGLGGSSEITAGGSSEMLAGSWHLSTSTSWLAGVGLGSSSWEVGASAAWQQALSSWGVMVGGSWQSGLKSSWETGIGASWETGVGSSGLSSWNSGAGGIGSSWSAQPFGAAQRGFHMHVNAEVIFYGGTDPNATVWIDGKQVQLQKDGTFYYHFIFPDKDHEIPIVARSPDGVEIRSATLSLSRRTSRVGQVDATGQPPHLGQPMGGK